MGHRFLVLMIPALCVAACGETEESTDCEPLTETITYTSDIKQVLDTHCTSCHDSALTGANRNKATADINYETYTLAKANGARASIRILAGTMPPSNCSDCTAVSTENGRLFCNWVDQGMPV